MVEVIDKVLSSLPEKDRFYAELKKMQIQPQNIPTNLPGFHEVLKGTFGKRHYQIESLIIRTLHENTKQGIYSEKEVSPVAIRLLELFTQEHKKEIDDAKKTLSQIGTP
jgi:hypothetical protein